ncbi:MAG: hypothetical protein ACRDN9_17295 [Streptosporangiaceae bacterium]
MRDFPSDGPFDGGQALEAPDEPAETVPPWDDWRQHRDPWLGPDARLSDYDLPAHAANTLERDDGDREAETSPLYDGIAYDLGVDPLGETDSPAGTADMLDKGVVHRHGPGRKAAVITSDAARDRAERTYNADKPPAERDEIGMYEFDEGYVAWRVPRTRADLRRPPQAVGGGVIVIDRETGAVSGWPLLDPETIAEQYRERRATG